MEILSGNISSNTENFIDLSTIFGSLKRTVLSKDFKGGQVKNVFGSMHLDFTYADINGIVTLDISQAFGELMIAVPSDWRVESDLSHFCSLVEEHRSYESRGYNSKKVLLLKGLSLFAVVDVVSLI
ncbi:LiaF domain-containing protein [Mucilaginibacter sp. UR6-11]|uniref:LiaF domain-containing protein n=1 Tax=Mucilaginibacter sp. UR6-11 TaxID=1435644 RepID=UPI001E43F8D5|nr:LiaF domain-containing protein [Mucilaginibacter sp. UR6-11]MCC8426186.1 cell wall-active antibiotics response protein [Mucilaginibacter sp. UR6-11]